MTQGLSSLFWFVAVLVAIPLVLWLVKRSGFGAGMLAPAALPGVPRTVASLVLSGQQRVVTVEVGSGDARTWLVLGVSPQGMQTLHTMPAGAAVSAPAASGVPSVSSVSSVSSAAFAQTLSRLMGRQSHAPR